MEITITEDKIPISADKLVTGRTCMIGQSGSGKSYAVAVVCEELAKNNIGFCIIDTEGEYFGLKEKYTVLWAGSDPNCDVDIEQVSLKDLAKKVVNNGMPLILDVSDVIDQRKIVTEFVAALYNVESQLRQPYLLIIEESDKFVPQSGEMIKEIDEIGRRGRKRGLGLLIASQRPALVNKNILSQCGNQIIGKLTINNDLEAVKIFFPNRKDLEKLPMLKPGEFFIQGDIGAGRIAKIRQRETPHKAVTPKVVAKAKVGVEELRKIEESLEQEKRVEEEISEKEVEEVKKLIILPKITKEKAFEIIKASTKQFKLFGKESPVSNLHAVLYPVIACEIKFVKKKMIGEEFKEQLTYFDGVSGSVLDLGNGFKTRYDVSELKGMSFQDIRILKVFKSKEKTNAEIENETGYSESAVRNSLEKLNEKKLIGSKKTGRVNTYFMLSRLEIPEIEKTGHKEVNAEEQKISASTIKPEADIKQINNFVKAIAEKAELMSTKTIYYPFYRATVLVKNKSESRFVDGITGKLSSKI
jgi:hypothetical protein